MLVKSDITSIERGGVQAEVGFTIKATAKAFNILSSSLYTNKILAIVRELSCNAYDSHVAAGIPNVPIEIRLPTFLDPTFYVRDTGLGLHDFDVRGYWSCNDLRISLEEGAERNLIDGVDGWVKNGGIYNTFFESTKTESNDFIGALGLGCKSPLSYASTFMMESRFNGTKCLYSCYKNEAGLPAITLMGCEDTDEPNGVTVTMAVRTSDVDNFTTAARRALMYFTPQPKVVGLNTFKPYELKHTVHGDNWRIRQTEYYAHMSGPYVVQGFVAYPVDIGQLEEHGLSDIAKQVIKTDIDLFVPIGHVDVAASREALSYDKTTIQNVAHALEMAAEQLRQRIQETFDELTSEWDVAYQHYNFQYGGTNPLQDVYKALANKLPFTWNGSNVTSIVQLDTTNLNQLRIRRVHATKGRRSTKYSLEVDHVWTASSTTKHFSFSVDDKVCFVIDDTDNKRSSDGRVAQWLSDKRTSGGEKMRVVVIDSPVPKQPVDLNSATQATSQMPSAKVVMMSTLPPVYKATSSGSRSYNKRSKEERLVWTGFTKETSRYSSKETEIKKFVQACWAVKTIQFDDHPTGVYVEIDRFTALTPTGAPSLSIGGIITALTNLKLVDTGLNVVGVPKRELERFRRDNPGWEEFHEFAAKLLGTANQGGRLTTVLAVNTMWQRVNSGWLLRKIISDWPMYRNMLKCEKLISATEDIIAIIATAECNITPEHIEQAITIHPSLVDVSDAATMGNTFAGDWNNALDKYPMVTLCDPPKSAIYIQHVIDYINSTASR